MGGGDARMFDQTATWPVVCVCAVIVIISVKLEHRLRTIGHFLKKRHKPGLMEALEKIKGELMVFGFISLLLVFSQNYITSICISKSLTKEEVGWLDVRRRLLYRRLAGKSPPKECDEGYEQIISVAGLHKLHIFIFFLACFHVMYSTLTMIFGRAKIRQWKVWEPEIWADHTPRNPSMYRRTHTIGGFASTPAMFYIVCFFRQFFTSVRRSDYLAMRNAFFSVHLAPSSHFNFQKYIKKSLEDDFKTIVGISPDLLWANAALFLFANVDGARVMTYLFVFPVIIILAVGTKLQAIVTQLAVEIQERQSVVQGMRVVELSDRHFWFSQPRLIMFLIQLTLFQNSFEITHFFWIWYEFGLDTCFYESPIFQYGRVIIGILVQFLCAYSILPLYALVTQTGSTMKRSIFDDQTSKVLRRWVSRDVLRYQTMPSPSKPRRLECTG